MRNALTAALLFSFYLHPLAILGSEELADTQKALIWKYQIKAFIIENTQNLK